MREEISQGVLHIVEQKIQQEIHDQMLIGEKQSAENKLGIEKEIHIIKKEMRIERTEEFMKLIYKIDQQNEIQTAEVAKLRRELQQGLHHNDQASGAFAQNMKREAHEQNPKCVGKLAIWVSNGKNLPEAWRTL